MPEMATLITSISGLIVAVGALVISVGVFYLVTRLGQSIENMSRNGSDEGS